MAKKQGLRQSGEDTPSGQPSTMTKSNRSKAQDDLFERVSSKNVARTINIYNRCDIVMGDQIDQSIKVGDIQDSNGIAIGTAAQSVTHLGSAALPASIPLRDRGANMAEDHPTSPAFDGQTGNRPTLHQFILDTFSEIELLTLCDGDDGLRKAQLEFSETMPFTEKVRRLIGFCRRRGLSAHLWAKVKAERRAQWAAFQMPENESGAPVEQAIADPKNSADFGKAEKTNAGANAKDAAQHRIKVFLSHSPVDEKGALALYAYLGKMGAQPWMGSMDLLPGQNGPLETAKMIASSDVIIVCLSSRSIDEEGVAQKEINFALDKALEVPAERIFLIPARLDACEIPFRLKYYQPVDLFEKNGRERLMKAIHVRAGQLGRLVG